MSFHLLYSDLHLRLDRIDDQIRCLDFIGGLMQPVIDSGGFVINGGDLFDEKGIVRTSCWDRLREVRVGWMTRGVKHIDNVGNHDQEDFQGTINPLKIFDHFDGCFVASEPTFVDPWWIIPYTRDLKKALKEVPDDSLVVIHAGVCGAKMSAGIEDEDGADPKLFSRFKRVFSGHYHRHQTVGKVTYIGSPMQQNFGEAGETKGVVIYDDKKDKFKFVEITGLPRFHKFVMGDDLADTPVACDDFVHVTVKGDRKVAMTSKEDLQKSLPGRLVKIDREITEVKGSRLSIDDVSDIDGLITQYVGHKDPPEDHKRLVKIGRELIA